MSLQRPLNILFYDHLETCGMGTPLKFKLLSLLLLFAIEDFLGAQIICKFNSKIEIMQYHPINTTRDCVQSRHDIY